MTTNVVEIPGYVAGTWTIDPVHSEVAFVVRHLMISKVRGRLTSFEGHRSDIRRHRQRSAGRPHPLR